MMRCERDLRVSINRRVYYHQKSRKTAVRIGTIKRRNEYYCSNVVFRDLEGFYLVSISAWLKRTPMSHGGFLFVLCPKRFHWVTPPNARRPNRPPIDRRLNATIRQPPAGEHGWPLAAEPGWPSVAHQNAGCFLFHPMHPQRKMPVQDKWDTAI